MDPPHKSVLLVIIDALASRVVRVAINDGRLPTLARLAEHGRYVEQCWSIFPSITPAATCSLHTGMYPQRHGIAGAYWYDRTDDRVAYFGDDIWPILRHGHGRFFRDFQVTLNYDHLRAPTIYELGQQAGLRTACLNSMWFRGRTPHKVELPWLFKLIPGTNPAKQLHGPEVLCLADFVSTDPDGGKRPLKAPGGALLRFGFHDEATAEYLVGLAERGPLPDASVAYFPNNDFESHERGPLNAVDALQRVDDSLNRLFEARGGMESFLQETAILITGDHSQSDVWEDVERGSIDLDEALSSFSLVPAGNRWDNGEQVMACPNLRMAQVYIRDGTSLREPVVQALLAEKRVDQVFWVEPSSANAETYHVATGDRGRLVFQIGKGRSQWGRDPFGGTWSWDGDLAALDATLEGETIHFGDYPNAFERITGAFFDEAGHVLVTARDGCEFVLPATTAHPGGSHGSLHALDSTSPLIVAGLPEAVYVPDPARTIDVVPLMLQSLGIPFSPAAGEARWPC